MQCGHAANATTQDGKQCCVICIGIHSGYATPVSSPDLTGRQARCPCGATKPSDTSLAFFEFRGVGSPHALKTCKCGYYDVAHAASPRRPKMDHEFQPAGPDAYDLYYCGHGGWD